MLEILTDHSSTFSWAAQENAYPLFRSIRLHYPQGEEGAAPQEGSAPLKNIRVKLTSSEKYFQDEEWRIEEISPGQTIRLLYRQMNIPRDVFQKFTEETRLVITITAYSSDAPDKEYCREEVPVTLLPMNYWGGETRQPELLAAFVKPNGVYVNSLVRQAAEDLRDNGHGGIDGYQSVKSGKRDKPYLMAEHLWNTVVAQGIVYVSPPPGFAKQGQPVRLPADISTHKMGACLDLSVLFAGCLEMMGLNPVIALTKGHAFVGVWLIDECFPVLTNDDPMDLRKRVDADDLIVFESTMVTRTEPFNASRQHARQLLEEEDQFVYLIDIKQARNRGIKPFSTDEQTPAEKRAVADKILPPPQAPVLPPVRADERVMEKETPETRIDRWKRKLLDLTKRNALLNLSDRAVKINLYCPDIGKMEDMLANETVFKFKTAEDGPSNDTGRSSEAYKLQTGDDLQKQYALQQLSSRILLANMSKSQLEKNAITLFRKAKNDLEEGGANTLYLALGMLRWKENPKDARSYRAPLILLPVELNRKSAKASIKLKQVADEDPFFNTTLIEFLNSDYEINLNHFRDSANLPRDASGVNVHEIWNTVRAAVAEQPGFEVVEDLALASFSFAKYLIWKDLEDRIDDLRENPFVRHLVDCPDEIYSQNSSFLKQEDVDEKTDPDQIFTPLNCDSSQLVAVEASGKDQDFVLEGPPGTGKSETIANIICHNLALGRKVLFVAEKMAALHVVYHRMQKIGLGHLCLELHSNKANKKAVLEQLRQSVEAQKSAGGSWREKARQLKDKRDHLNKYVEALHDKSIYKISVYDAVARSAYYKDRHALKLGWRQFSLENAPVRNALELEKMRAAVEEAAVAYQEISRLDKAAFGIVQARQWSHDWQENAQDCLQRCMPALDDVYSAAEDLAAFFDIKALPKDINNLAHVDSLAQLVESAEQHPLSYLLGKGGADSLENLKTLAELKKDFDGALNSVSEHTAREITGEDSIAEKKKIYQEDTACLEELHKAAADFNQTVGKIQHNVSPEKLENTPVGEWQSVYRQAKDSFFKRWFAKRKINKSAKELGYARFDDLDILSDIERAITEQKAIRDIASRLRDCDIWQGWNTSPGSIAEEIDRRMKIMPVFENAAHLQEQIRPLTAAYEADKIWQGWGTAPDSLTNAHARGESAYGHLKNAMNLTDDHAAALASAKSKLADGRDFLAGSKLAGQKAAYQECRDKYRELEREMQQLAIIIDKSMTAEDARSAIDYVINHAAKLSAWISWSEAKNAASVYQLESIMEALETESLSDAGDVKAQLETAFCRWLAPKLIDKSDILRTFSAARHEHLIEEFRSLDKAIADTTSAHIAAIASQSLPDMSDKNQAKKFSTLTRELQKRQRHIPVRALISATGESILDLCPCMMMSPLSVAQFLPSDFNHFDIVVFDEASQMTTWDSVGAIARGRNVVVVGDPKQMPPTNFFHKTVDADNPDEEDLESILDQALDARLPHLRLKGHYRSRHESLIAFSNSNYYENSLVTYPSSHTKRSAVSLHRIDGVYSKGRGRNNPKEAQAVVSEIVKRIKGDIEMRGGDDALPKQSMGVVTLNTEQQRMIDDLLDEARRKDPKIEEYFVPTDDYDPVFVKNLESVQGDERDVIVLSLCYGPTEPGATAMSMNFGPLNRTGGERRLNVAITRAKSEVLLFSSFDSSMIDLSRSSAQAVEHLKHYVEYAEKGPGVLAGQASADHGVDQFDSIFEEEVARALRNKGWDVQTQVGVSRFRIDLGIKHPDFPGEYIAGVECDGATYHRSPSARDRDRVRHLILENLGWNIIRVWSTDYFRDPDGAISRVDKKLGEILERLKND